MIGTNNKFLKHWNVLSQADRIGPGSIGAMCEQCGNHEGRVWTAEKAQCSTTNHQEDRGYVRALSRTWT